MRACIVTIVDYSNYGNRLQNIALTEILKSLGIESLSGLQVFSRSYWINSSSGVKKIIKRISSSLGFRLYVKKTLENYYPSDKLERVKRIEEYTNKYVDSLPLIIVKDDAELIEKLKKYNFSMFVVGSDQVWNPYFSGTDTMFLSFAPKEKRFAFSASIGVKRIPKYKEEQYKKYLSEFSYISVRERSAVGIIEDLVKRNVDFIPDPTLLLQSGRWNEFVKKPNFSVDSSYIVTYFLGETPKELIKELIDGQQCYIFLNDKSNSQYYNIDPGEFLYLIKNADQVITDSFHAVVFSIIFHKDFWITRRLQKNVEDMFDRLDNILTLLELADRIVDDVSNIQSKPILEDRWLSIDRKLIELRIESLEKFKEAINKDIIL